jgi:hypothetical protein
VPDCPTFPALGALSWLEERPDRPLVVTEWVWKARIVHNKEFPHVVLPMRSTAPHGTQVVRRTDGAVVGDHYSWSGLVVSLGPSANAIPRVAAEAVYSPCSASLNWFQSPGKIASREILTPKHYRFCDDSPRTTPGRLREVSMYGDRGDRLTATGITLSFSDGPLPNGAQGP